MNQTERMMDIWLYIVRHREFTAGELAEKYGVSVRTIVRDLEQLSLMGVPLYTAKGRGGGYRVLDSVQLPPISFSEEELKSVLFAYYMLELAGDNPFRIEITSVQEKLIRQMPEYIREKNDALVKHLDFMYPRRKTEVPELRKLYLASEDRAKVLAEYGSKDGAEAVAFFPIGAYEWNGFWYTVGYLPETEKYRIFRIDRFLSCTVIRDEVAPDHMWTLSEWKEHGRDGEKQILIELEATPEALRTVTNEWMHQGTSTVMENGNIHLSFFCPQRQIEFVIPDILKLGSGAKVLAPMEIMEQVQKTTRKMYEIYQ